jgi:hypothetical protein
VDPQPFPNSRDVHAKSRRGSAPVTRHRTLVDDADKRLEPGPVSPLDNRSVPPLPGNGASTGTFLVDGMWQGIRQIRARTFRVQPFTKVRHPDRDALLAEAAWSTVLASMYRIAGCCRVLLSVAGEHCLRDGCQSGGLAGRHGRSSSSR